MSASDAVPWALSAFTIVTSLYVSLRGAKNGERSELHTRLDACEKTLQIMRRREVWHESNLALAVDAIRDAGGQVPAFPAPPAVYPTEAS